MVCCGAFLSVGSVAAGADLSENRYASSITGGDAAVHGNGGNFSFSGRVLLYNWGGAGRVPNFEKKVFWGGDLFRSTRAVGDIKSNLGWNSDFDFSGDVSFEYFGDGDVAYGADFQLLVPEVSDAVEREGKALVNRGSRVYALTPYGKFSVGYQEGVETARDGGFDDFIRGKDPSFMKYRLPLLKGDFFVNGAGQWLLNNSAILYPGLYSEAMFRSNNYLNYYGFEDQSRYYSKYFVNNLPFRISYQSPNFMGVRFGFSYSPSGYADDLFTAWLPRSVVGIASSPSKLLGDSERVPLGGGYRRIKRKYIAWLRHDEQRGFTRSSWNDKSKKYPEKVWVHPVNNVLTDRRFSYAPAYKNILSSILSVNRVLYVGGDKVSVGFSLSGEYAASPSSRGIEDVIEPTGGFCDLFSAEFSAYGSVRGFSFGGTYGYLGKSGYPMGPWEDTNLSWDFDEISGGTMAPSRYLVGGVGYSFGPFRIDSSYLMGTKGGYLVSVESRDLGARLSYELYRGEGLRCALFAQYHRVSARYTFSQGFVETLGRGAMYAGKMSDDGKKKPLKYGYDLFGFGVKLAF